ncbi:MAG: DUF1273 family protein [Candidatus Altiarchaeales archaeon]|nr:DUF1273 family protein [Candidatus Altiarchaeales archaeon]
MIVTFTGHRPPKLGGYKYNPITEWVTQKTYEIILDLAQKFSPDLEFRSGCALGFDQIAAWTMQLVQSVGYNPKLVLYMPYPSYGSNWPLKSQTHLNHLIESVADDVIYVSGDPHSNEKIHLRNQEMIKGADLVIACWDGSRGETKNTIQLALKKCNVLRINPANKSVGMLHTNHKTKFRQLPLWSLE